MTVGPAVNELGVYGIFLSDGKEVLHNEAAGHLLRTKVRSAAWLCPCVNKQSLRGAKADESARGEVFSKLESRVMV